MGHVLKGSELRPGCRCIACVCVFADQEHEARIENWKMKLKTSQCLSFGFATLNRMMNCNEKITSATERQKIRPEGC